MAITFAMSNLSLSNLLTATNVDTVAPFSLSNIATACNLSSYPTTNNPIRAGFYRGVTYTPAVATPENYPPAALTGSTTTLSGKAYGNGTYTLSASSFLAAGSWPLHAAFNYVTDGSDTWSSADFYNNTGAYTGSKTTTISGSSVAGEWIQIQLPAAIALTSYTIWPFTVDISRNPRGFQVAGSADGTTWTLVNNQTNVTGWTANIGKTFNVTGASAYRNFRIVCLTSSGGVSYCLSEMRLFGV